MISRDLAVALRTAGVRWTPASGDRFTMLDPAFEHDVFTLAEMVVEPTGPPEARELGFNGTTEWALDSVDQSEALWLPREDQLRGLVGPFFEALHRRGDGYAVRFALPGRPVEEVEAATAEDAYALAALRRLAAAGFGPAAASAPAGPTSSTASAPTPD